MKSSTTIVSVYSSSLSAATSLWCCWNKSPRKAWKKETKTKQKGKNEPCHVTFIFKCSFTLEDLHFNRVGEAAKGHERQCGGRTHDTPAAHWRLGLQQAGLLKRCSLHLELLGRYVATAVHVILPPDLQETGYGELISDGHGQRQTPVKYRYGNLK